MAGKFNSDPPTQGALWRGGNTRLSDGESGLRRRIEFRRDWHRVVIRCQPESFLANPD